MSEFDRQIRALRDMARNPGALELVQAAADEWVKVAGQRAPVDTGYLQSSIYVRSKSGTAHSARAEVVAQANYAGYVEFGTRYQAPQPYFRHGRDSAEQFAADAEGKVRTSVERAMAGGSWGPPRF